MSRALDGVIVLDLTTGVDGPFATKLLADQGARVLKVEGPAGDPTRWLGPFPDDEPHADRGALFVYLNTNKEGLSLDLGTESDRELLRSLVRRVDVLVENSPVGDLDDLGLGHEELLALNPSLVVCSITPFGRSGPYAAWRGPDIVRQAMSGWLHQGGDPDREPLRSGGDISLYITGTCAAAAALTALYHARETGEGQHVDVSAMEALITVVGQEIYRTGLGGSGVAFDRTGHRGLPFAMVRASDGYVGMNILYERDWPEMCRLVGMEELLDDPCFSLAEIRHGTAGVVVHERLAAWAEHRRCLDIVEAGQARRLSFTMVPTVEQARFVEHFRERGFVVSVPDDEPHGMPGYDQPGAPFILGDSPWAITRRAPRWNPERTTSDTTQIEETFGAADH